MIDSLKIICLPIVCVCLLIMHLSSTAAPHPLTADSDPLLAHEDNKFVGSEECLKCHTENYNLWFASDHQKAMQVADESSVLGDFNNQAFRYGKVESTFFVKEGEYWITTDGPTGSLESYQVSYTFGHYPLQQYLVGFPDGRLQALSIAWDSRTKEEGGQKWIHLYPNEIIDHNDRLHWTGTHHTWNSRCADCHSTALKKGYDSEHDRYETRYQEISVACEACHGPGKEHLDWVKKRPMPDSNGTLNDEIQDSHYGVSQQSEILQCGGCHSRRVSLAQAAAFIPQNKRNSKSEPNTEINAFLGHFNLRTLEETLYYPDGQIQDEVFVLGSFLQSKMYRAGVKCTQCHNPHSLQLRQSGNDLCTQCHQQAVYSQPSHHHHPSDSNGRDSSGSQCVNCHMPATHFMQVDARRDHSFKIPRPDLSEELGSPNACSQCHQDKPLDWINQHFKTWYPQRTKTATHAKVIHNARQGKIAALPDLLALIDEEKESQILRATALRLLDQYPSQEAITMAIKQLKSENALLRREAAQLLEILPPQQRVSPLLPLLEDPVKNVRLVTTQALIPALQFFSPTQRIDFARNLKELLVSRREHNDIPSGLLQLGILYENLNQWSAALDAYDRALALDSQFLPALVNKADVLRRLRQDHASYKALQQALILQPQNPEVNHALGLWFIRQNKPQVALPFLKKAWQAQPDNPRLIYIVAVTLYETGNTAKAIATLEKGLLRHPGNERFESALKAYRHNQK